MFGTLSSKKAKILKNIKPKVKTIYLWFLPNQNLQNNCSKKCKITQIISIMDKFYTLKTNYE